MENIGLHNILRQKLFQIKNIVLMSSLSFSWGDEVTVQQADTLLLCYEYFLNLYSQETE